MPALDPPALSGLRGIALLQGLPDDVLREVAAACRFRLYQARQTVIAREDADRDCYLVVSGALRVVALSPGGREVSFRDAAAGEAIGEMAAIDGRPRSATVVALQESTAGTAEPGRPAHRLMRRHWPIAERMLRRLAGAARALTERVYELSAFSVQQRLCAELVRLALAAGGASGDPRRAEPGPSHGKSWPRASAATASR
ncbi:MAG: cyclic nucleotide-binding domain-containing protein [Rubrivivax sp.]